MPRKKHDLKWLRKKWHNMRHRCAHNAPPATRRNYYERGIQVCSRWLNSFEDFVDDMGFPPSDDKHTIDRIDNNGDYKPDNCRWVTQSEQMRNTRSNHFICIAGEYITVAELAERLGEKQNTVTYRLLRGWTIVECCNGKRILPSRSVIKQRWAEIEKMRDEGMTFAEIGEIIGCDGSNISRKFCRKMKKLPKKGKNA